MNGTRETAQELHQVFCEIQQEPSEATQRFFSVHEVLGYIEGIADTFLRIHQMQHLIQKCFHLIKHKGIDFVMPVDKNTFNFLEADVDEDAYEAIADLKMLLREMQKRIKEITATGCSIENLELGQVSWPSLQEQETVSLRWQLGQDTVSIKECTDKTTSVATSDS